MSPAEIFLVAMYRILNHDLAAVAWRAVRGLGTLINTGTVLIGGGVGYFIGHRIPESMRVLVMQVVGLATMIMGIQSAMDTHNIVFPLIGTVFGAIIGEILKIEERLESVGEWLKKKFARNSTDESTFVKGFFTATLLFCIGPLTILGRLKMRAEELRSSTSSKEHSTDSFPLCL